MKTELTIPTQLAVIVDENSYKDVTPFDRSVVRIICYLLQMGPVVLFDNGYICEFLTKFEGHLFEYDENQLAASLGKLLNHEIIEIEFVKHGPDSVSREISSNIKTREYNY